MSRKRSLPRYLLTFEDLRELLRIAENYQNKGYIYFKTPSIREFLKYKICEPQEG